MPWGIAPELPWAADDLALSAVVDVASPCQLAADPAPDYRDSLVGIRVSADRKDLRDQRAKEAASVPSAFAWALAGEIGASAPGWSGRFAVAQGSPRGLAARCHRLGNALLAGTPLDPVLSTFASDRPLLVSWVDHVEAVPVTALAMPGEVYHSAVGPVVSDLFAEPYLVRLRVGTALVDTDGTVVVRLSDELEAVLSDEVGPDRAGRSLARDLAGEVAKIWPSEVASR